MNRSLKTSLKKVSTKIKVQSGTMLYSCPTLPKAILYLEGCCWCSCSQLICRYRESRYS